MMLNSEPILRYYYLAICLNALRKTAIGVSPESRYPDRDLKPGRTEYEGSMRSSYSTKQGKENDLASSTKSRSEDMRNSLDPPREHFQANIYAGLNIKLWYQDKTDDQTFSASH
jgi:hypothetical protein